jgi:hypothetical protein
MEREGTNDSYDTYLLNATRNNVRHSTLNKMRLILNEDASRERKCVRSRRVTDSNGAKKPSVRSAGPLQIDP